ncbi:ABC transporter substrate-binding protein [Streptomyces pathocidini]|uniref:ABC transporter substrate-binding protein n=1 Tax=Streptomyces pathocidini TaxID=1650571 RepID=UPI0033D2FE72
MGRTFSRTPRGPRAGRGVRTAGAALAAVALAVTAAGCGGDSLESKSSDSGDAGTGGGKKGSLVIGSAGFTESALMAQLYSRLLADAGYSTSIKTLKNRELYEPALEKGQIDVVPEYAATLAEFLNGKKNGPKAEPVASSDVDKTVAVLEKLAEPRGLKVLPVGEAVDQNAFAVSGEFAEKHRLKTLSDLGKSGQKIKLAAGDECDIRPFCRPGLEETYGIDITAIDPKGVGTTPAKQAVKDGTDQLVLTTTTDATLTDFGLVLLEDDKGLQNADNLLPVVSAESAGDKDVEAALDKLTKVLTTDDLIDLNRKVDAERQKPADVAEEFLKSKGLLSK